MGIDLIFPEGFELGIAMQSLMPVMVVVAGMAAYAIFIFKFYRFIAARDMFGLDLSRNDGVRDAVLWDLIFLVWYVVRYLILFPAFAFFWFSVMTLILIFLSEDRALTQTLLIAMATVSAIRVSAYYNEDLSRDLAKILPFAVLGVFIIDTTFFNIAASLEALREIGAHRGTIAYYLLFLVALEFGLRFIFVIFKLLFPTREKSGVGTRPDAPAREQPGAPAGNRAPAREGPASAPGNGAEPPARMDRETEAGRPAG